MILLEIVGILLEIKTIINKMYFMKHSNPYVLILLILILIGCKTQTKKNELNSTYMKGDTIYMQQENPFTKEHELYGCCLKGDTITITSKELYNKSLYRLIRSAINTGNPFDYATATNWDICIEGDRFLLDLIMANKYHFDFAYTQIYAYYMPYDFNDSIWNSLDSVSQHRALKYLRLGAEAENKEAQRKIGELYLNGKAIPKDIETGNYWIRRSKIAANTLAIQRFCIIKNENINIVYDLKY
jgi:hypothetical protein